ncbi:MAG TPA: GyrI-like domain-containing protein [Pirellulaceae bacterium]|nr:GyrI-like domain-containing protein [Pirellulaceae bacterium]
MLQPQIVEKPALTVVGLEASFLHALSPQSTTFKVIPALWESFLHRAKEVPARLGAASYGIIYGRPEAQRSHPHELQYIAGVAVRSTDNVPAGMVAHTVAPGTFAVFLHRGSIAKIGDTCREIYRVWLPQSAWEHAGIADVELYDERFAGQSDRSEMEYWVSVMPKMP